MTPKELLLHAIRSADLDDPQAIDHAHANDRRAHAWDLEGGRQAAWWAASYGRVRMLRRLIQLGCDVNHCSQNGWSALIMASAQGHLDVVRLLLDHNALTEQQSTNGNRALSCAAYWGHIDICRLLVKRDAKLSPADQPENMRGPLATAVRYNRHETSAYLRAVIAAGSYGAYIDRTYNDLYVLRLLVHQGRATIRTRGSRGNPLDEKLVYAMKCFVAMEDGTEKTLLKNIFEW